MYLLLCLLQTNESLPQLMYVLSKWIIKRKVLINPHSWIIWSLLSRKVYIYILYIYMYSMYICVCMCVCVYVYICICIYVCVCVCVCIYIYICICIVFNTSCVLDVYLSMDYQATETWFFCLLLIIYQCFQLSNWCWLCVHIYIYIIYIDYDLHNP